MDCFTNGEMLCLDLKQEDTSNAFRLDHTSFVPQEEHKNNYSSSHLDEAVLRTQHYLKGNTEPYGEHHGSENQRSPKKSRRTTDPNMRIGHWTSDEKKKYHWFLEMYHGHFQQKQLRRMDKIFKTMADTLGTRAADQCRSHHQKMEKKYYNFYNIIFKLRHIHYQCAEVSPMEAEMKMVGLIPHDGLISEDELRQRMDTYEEQPRTARTPGPVPNSRKKIMQNRCLTQPPSTISEQSDLMEGAHLQKSGSRNPPKPYSSRVMEKLQFDMEGEEEAMGRDYFVGHHTEYKPRPKGKLGLEFEYERNPMQKPLFGFSEAQLSQEPLI